MSWFHFDIQFLLNMFGYEHWQDYLRKHGLYVKCRAPYLKIYLYPCLDSSVSNFLSTFHTAFFMPWSTSAIWSTTGIRRLRIGCIIQPLAAWPGSSFMVLLLDCFGTFLFTGQVIRCQTLSPLLRDTIMFIIGSPGPTLVYPVHFWTIFFGLRRPNLPKLAEEGPAKGPQA